MTRRETVEVGGVPISYLTAGGGGPPSCSCFTGRTGVAFGSRYSRASPPRAFARWRWISPASARSGGELTVSEASVPRLSAWLVPFHRSART